jgi:lysophospholipase L1-like esterase
MVKYFPLLLGLLLWLPGLTSASDNTQASSLSRSQPTTNVKTRANLSGRLSNASWKAPQAVHNIVYLGDSYLDDGNYEAITGFPEEFFSNEPPWGTDVNVALGLTAVGRWTVAGSPPNPPGNNYAVAGASIEGSLTPVDTSFQGQVNLLLSDYPHRLPSDTLVVVAIGTNDIIGAMDLGGIWSANLFGWRLNHSGFTVPAIGSTITVNVADTTDLVAGPNNLVAFPNSSSLRLFSVTTVNAQTSTVTLTNVSATPGTKLSQNASFKMAASYIIDLEIPVFAQGINALLAHGANLVLTLPWRADFLPLYDRQADQTLAYSTWLYLYVKMATAIAEKSPQALYFDLSGFFDTVFFNFTEYGFLYNYPGWDANPNVSANEYMFWDNLHPSGLMQRLTADDFIAFLTQLDLVGNH